jgi:hypothetical protein
MNDASVPVARLACLHAAFLADVLPRVERHGHVYFRHVKCPDRQEELLAELRGLAWKWYVRLVRRGKKVLQFVSALATYAARAVNSGRRDCGHEKAKDVLSPVAHRRRTPQTLQLLPTKDRQEWRSPLGIPRCVTVVLKTRNRVKGGWRVQVGANWLSSLSCPCPARLPLAARTSCPTRWDDRPGLT